MYVAGKQGIPKLSILSNAGLFTARLEYIKTFKHFE